MSSRCFDMKSPLNALASIEKEFKKESLRESFYNRKHEVLVKGEIFFVSLAAIVKVSPTFHALILRNEIDISPQAFEAVVMLFGGDRSYLTGHILPEIFQFALEKEDSSLLKLLWKFLTERRSSVTVDALCKMFSLAKNAKEELFQSREEKLEIMAILVVGMMENDDRQGYIKVVMDKREDVAHFVAKGMAGSTKLVHTLEPTSRHQQQKCSCVASVEEKNGGTRRHIVQTIIYYKCTNCKTIVCPNCCKFKRNDRTCPALIARDVINNFDKPVSPTPSQLRITTTPNSRVVKAYNSPSTSSGYSSSKSSPEQHKDNRLKLTPPVSYHNTSSSSSGYTTKSSPDQCKEINLNVCPPVTRKVRVPRVPQKRCIFVDDDE